MSDLLGYQRRVAWFCLCLGGVVAGGLYLWLPARWGFGAGVLLGTVAGLIRMRIMATAILQMMSSAEAGNAHRNLFRHQMIGYVILAAALFGGFHLGGRDMGWAVLAGLLLPNIVLALDGYLRPVQAGVADAEAGSNAAPKPGPPSEHASEQEVESVSADRTSVEAQTPKAPESMGCCMEAGKDESI